MRNLTPALIRLAGVRARLGRKGRRGGRHLTTLRGAAALRKPFLNQLPAGNPAPTRSIPASSARRPPHRLSRAATPALHSSGRPGPRSLARTEHCGARSNAATKPRPKRAAMTKTGASSATLIWPRSLSAASVRAGSGADLLWRQILQIKSPGSL